MSSSFDFDQPDRVIPGAEGPPGQRVFYLQASQSGQVISLQLEKQQVLALAAHLTAVLADLPSAARAEVRTEDTALVEPVLPEWVVGELGAAYLVEEDRIVIVASEVEREDPPPSAGALGHGRFHLTREQAATFVVVAAQLAAGGRPPCPLCHRPIDPEGHACPKSNGSTPH